ncbi:MAG: hypothetical protein FJ304_28095 [Planctomycetes bacterium]|nr:hypothetical protein [Planctomycetota bacterium]
MPKAACPSCRSEVKYAKDAPPGSTVTCPECDETFTPPKLKPQPKKAYNPTEDEDTLKVQRASSNDATARDRAAKVKAAVRGAARREQELYGGRRHERRKGWFEGPEVWLLILAAGTVAGLPFGFWLARSWDTLGNARMFLVIVVLLAVMAMATGAAGSTWAWLRRNR